jgi:hypothetical protein
MEAIQIPLHSIGKLHLHDTSNLSEVSEKGENWAIHNISVSVISFIEIALIFRCDIPFVIITEMKEGRHKMLRFAFLIGFQVL